MSRLVAKTLLDQALAQHRQGELARALGLYRRVLETEPGNVKAQTGLAAALAAQGRVAEAIDFLEQAKRGAPDRPEIEFALANALRMAGRSSEAMAGYRRVIELAPDSAAAQINLGALLLTGGNAAEAIPVLRAAVRRAPRHAFAWSNLAGALLLHGETSDCMAAARRAIELDQSNPTPHVVLGNARATLKQNAAARASLETALSLQPDNREALIALANHLSAVKDFDGAIAQLQRAVQLDPEDPCTLGTLVMLLQRACRWDETTRHGAALDRLAFSQGNTPAEPLLASVSRSPDPRRTFAVARAWARMIESKMGFEAEPRRARPPKDRLRIGYLSDDFRDHPIGQLTRGLFAQHDRAGFDVLGFSYGPDDGSETRRHIVHSCDGFIDLARMTHVEAAAAIEAEAIDVLVELTGHTKANRLEICALRPAPVQVTWLGFPGTTGAGFIDYILGDAVVTPESEAAHYSEALVILPHSYQVNDRWQEIAESPGTRLEHGLPAQGFVFASLINSYKIEPVMFACWMRLLAKLPGSVLWLLSQGEAVETRLRDAAATEGIDPARLIFAPFLPRPEHLARLALADLALDTRIYNGHTTTSDCLFAGLPVVAVKGSHFASRVSESLLRAIELPQLVAEDLAGYEALAAELARDPERLAKLKAELAAKRMTTPLFDTAAMARNLERAYRAMWNQAVTRAAPAMLRVDPPRRA
jgi:predicted O-linked N-acetylglucosamine transferase (SPINDLY family)